MEDLLLNLSQQFVFIKLQKRGLFGVGRCRGKISLPTPMGVFFKAGSLLLLFFIRFSSTFYSIIAVSI